MISAFIKEWLESVFTKTNSVRIAGLVGNDVYKESVNRLKELSVWENFIRAI